MTVEPTESQVAAAAFCVSSVERWREFEQSWRKIADRAGFELQHFHMTEFAVCRRNNLCQQSLRSPRSANVLSFGMLVVFVPRKIAHKTHTQSVF